MIDRLIENLEADLEGLKLYDAIEVFRFCETKDLYIKLPEIELDRNVFVEVKKLIQNAGGKWVGGKKQHFAFAFNPEFVLDLLKNGEKPNFQQDNQFFETPYEVIDQMLAYNDFCPYQRGDKDGNFLEPEAGRFAIGKVLHECRPDIVIDCYELNPYNRQILSQLPYANLLGSDFLLAEPQKKYNWIFANPPFAKMQDAVHVMHMAKFLEPYGRITTVMSTGWQNKDCRGAYKVFNEFLESRHHEVYELEKDAFLLSGTKVSACIVIIDGENYYE